jgi:hypothetical protein
VRLLERGADRLGPLDDDRLVALMLGDDQPPTKIGIDAPLGWPVAFTAAVADLDAWPLADEVEPVALIRRASDRWIHAETGKLPLSVSTDRIAYPAMRAARLVRRYRQAAGRPVDRTGMTGAVCEVYPDTAVTRFGLRGVGAPRASYKAAGGAAARDAMLDRLTAQAPWLALSAAQRQACVATDDHFDALIAALIARAVELGATHPPPDELAPDAAVEGWIHLPLPGALARLAP